MMLDAEHRARACKWLNRHLPPCPACGNGVPELVDRLFALGEFGGKLAVGIVCLSCNGVRMITLEEMGITPRTANVSLRRAA